MRYARVEIDSVTLQPEVRVGVVVVDPELRKLMRTLDASRW